MKNKISKTMLLSLLFVGLCGCSLTRQALATFQSTSNFLVLDSDRRIHYEPGTEAISEEIAEYLPDSIKQIEKEQYNPFPKPVDVYICATKESFSHFTGQPQVVVGVTTIKHVFLSAERLRELPTNIRRAKMIHELSHLLLQQYLGAYNYGANLPAWFQEGLAENVSGGASMYDVNEAEAIKEILESKHFVPDTTGSFFFPKRWNSYGLKPHMFYRQSFMFVAFLKHLDDNKFRVFVLALENGRSFEDSFNSSFGINANVAWQQFVAQLKVDNEKNN